MPAVVQTIMLTPEGFAELVRRTRVQVSARISYPRPIGSKRYFVERHRLRLPDNEAERVIHEALRIYAREQSQSV